AVDEDLVPVDAVELLVSLGQLSPGDAEGIAFQPPLQPPLPGLVRGEAPGEQLPGDAADQDIQQGVEAFAVTLGWAAVAAPDDGGQDGLEDGPDLLGNSAGDVLQFHGAASWGPWLMP